MAKSDVVESVKKRWQQLMDKEKQYKDMAKVHIDLVERMEKHAPDIEPFVLEEETVLAKLRAGTPLLEGEADRIELGYAVSLFRELADWPGAGDARKQLKKWQKSQSDADIEQVLRGWIKGDPEPFTRRTFSSGLPQDVLSVILQYSLLPTLHAYGGKILPAHALLLENWQEGYCPVCGDAPALAEIRDSERFRYLRCISCGGDWPFRRIACPACGNNDHERLESYLIEDPKTGVKQQIDVCEECKSYVKVLNKLQPASPVMLILDDLSTTHLDLFAVEKGYFKGGKPDGPIQ